MEQSLWSNIEDASNRVNSSLQLKLYKNLINMSIELMNQIGPTHG